MARGGAIFVSDGQLHLTNTLLTHNLATSPPAVGQPAASGQGRGNSIFIEGGGVTYVLPAPPGRWLPAQSCEVCGQQQTRTAFSPPQFTPSRLSSRLTLLPASSNPLSDREACPRDRITGRFDDPNCPRTRDECAEEAEESAFVTVAGVTTECRPATFNQPYSHTPASRT